MCTNPVQHWCLLWMKYRNINHWTGSLVDQLAEVKELYRQDITIIVSVARVLVLTVWFPKEIMSGK